MATAQYPIGLLDSPGHQSSIAALSEVDLCFNRTFQSVICVNAECRYALPNGTVKAGESINDAFDEVLKHLRSPGHPYALLKDPQLSCCIQSTKAHLINMSLYLTEQVSAMLEQRHFPPIEALNPPIEVQICRCCPYVGQESAFQKHFAKKHPQDPIQP